VLTAAQKQRLKELGSGETEKDKKADAVKPGDAVKPIEKDAKKPN